MQQMQQGRHTEIVFSQFCFLDCRMEAFRQRKWDLGESSLKSLIGSFENCSKTSKKSPAPAYFVTNKISPPLVREILLKNFQPNALKMFEKPVLNNWRRSRILLGRFPSQPIDKPVIDFCQQSYGSVDYRRIIWERNPLCFVVLKTDEPFLCSPW